MYSTPDGFLEALRRSHTPTFGLELLADDEVLDVELILRGGAVSVDGGAAIRRRGQSIRVLDPTGDLVPSGATDPLSPYGFEIRPYRGILGFGDPLPLGTLRIASSHVVGIGDEGVEIAIEAYDRARMIQRNRFEAPYVVAQGTNYVAAIKSLIQSRYPQVIFDSVSTSVVTPLLVFDELADPWKCAQDMADSIGCELFFDPMGICVIRYQPNPSDEPVFEYAHGERSTFLEIENTLTDEPGYNGAIVTGEQPGVTPVKAIAWDDDPDSPTYYLGRYNRVPFAQKSQFITTQAQADAAAEAALQRERGGSESVSLTAIPNPAHEAGDVIHCQKPSLDIDDNYVVDSFTVPLDLKGSMSLETKRRRTQL